jgi:hypothetical protein
MGLGVLVTSRNAVLRSAGFMVLPATTLEEVGETYGFACFDVAIVGHAFSNLEKRAIVAFLKKYSTAVVILVTSGEFLGCLPADSYWDEGSPPEDLIHLVRGAMEVKRRGSAGRQ